MMDCMETNRMTRPQAVKAIQDEVASLGHAGRESTLAYVTSGISRAQYDAAVQVGLGRHWAGREAERANLFVLALVGAVAR